MIKLEAKLPQDKAWIRLCKRAVEKHALHLQMYAAKQPIEISDSLYKALGRAFFAESTVKCAYCENEFRLNQAGDVEHFRPKGRVTDENDQVVYIGAGAKDNPILDISGSHTTGETCSRVVGNAIGPAKQQMAGWLESPLDFPSAAHTPVPATSDCLIPLC